MSAMPADLRAVARGAPHVGATARGSARRVTRHCVRDDLETRRRVLVLCLGGIGDTILGLAALRDLRRACPSDHLTALAMWPQSAELLSDLGLFDEVLQHNFQRAGYWPSLRMARRLRQARYDASLLLFPANRFEYNLLCRLIGTPQRFGHEYLRGGNTANLRFLLTHRVGQLQGRHTVDENRALVAAFTGRPPAAAADIRLGPLATEYHHFAAGMLGHLDRPLIGIHAGCTVYKGHAARRWPAERFGALCHRLIAAELQPVLFGMPDEIDLKLRIQADCPRAFFAHGPSIRHTGAMISRCTAFVSNDSGLAHLAAAVEVPVVMICGPTATWSIGPRSAGSAVIRSSLPCSPCFLVSRRPVRCTHATYQACLHAVQVEPVFEALQRIVARQPVALANGNGDALAERVALVSLPVLSSRTEPEASLVHEAERVPIGGMPC